MAATAEKTSKPTATRAPAETTFFGKAHGGGFFAPARLQPKLTVSKPGDSLEVEADRTAERVTRTEPLVARMATGGPGTAATASVEAAATGGRQLPEDLRMFLQPRLGADLSGVRVHDDSLAATLSNRLAARAFTYRNHIFFAGGQYQPDTADGVRLLTHELTHTIQQGQSQPLTPDRGAAVPAAAAAPTVQRLGVQGALDYFAGKANNIPGFRMLTLVLGFNPINLRGVDRSAANLLRALIELIPGGALITQVLDTHGVIEKAAAWATGRLRALGDIGGQITGGLGRFVDSLSWRDIVDLGGVWDRAKRIFTDPIGALIAFTTGLVTDILAMVRDAILRPLAGLAVGTRGYDLLRALLGRDPITGEVVPRTADTVIGGFMKLIGQEEVWQNLKRGNAVGRAWAWFTGALTGLMALVSAVPGRILATLRSLTFVDVVTVAGAFGRIVSTFAGIAGDFFGWGLRQVLGLLEILFSVVAPGVMPYLTKARAAFGTIMRDPVRFVGNLVRAGRLGFEMFARNIGEHLKTALIKWLTGPLGEAGVYIPTAFTLLEIVKLVLSVLGLTWQNIRGKLVKIIPEPVLVALEKTAAVLVTLVTQGPAAAWEQIKAELTELKDQLIGQVTEMITTEVVKAAVTKLVSMLNPAGAVIQAIIATYNTVTFFIQKIQQIAAVVAAFIDSVAAIASGQVDAAAKKVEQTMAGTLTVIIAFLAKFAGLGNVPEKLVGIVKRIRQPIDKGLDRIVAWLGQILQKIKAGAAKLVEWWKKKVPVHGGEEEHVLTFEGTGPAAKLVVRSTPEQPSDFLRRIAQKLKVTGAPLTVPVGKVEKAERRIEKQQEILRDIDSEAKRTAVSGKRADQADTASTKLDLELEELANLIGATLYEWGARDGEVSGVDIPRGSFTVDQKLAIADEHVATGGDPSDIVRGAAGPRTRLRKSRKLARRHVVSAHDMGSHYEKVLNRPGMLWSAAKLLIEQRGSTGDSDVVIAVTAVAQPLTLRAVRAAAKERYNKFFGYAKNIFLGDSKKNSSIQQHLDDGNEALADEKLYLHVRRIKRSWALDGTFEETPVKKG